jgi:cyclin-dependent kinase 12/13
VPFSTTSFTYSKEPIQTWSGPLVDPAGVGAPRRKKKNTGDARGSSNLPTGKDKSRDTQLKGKKSMA